MIRPASNVSLGALLVDGLAVGFWPDVYGQSDSSLTGLAGLLLWGVAALLIGAGIADASRRPRA